VNDFLDMGGYAAFVWPAFGISAAVLVGLLISSLHGLRAREAELALLQRERRSRRPVAAGAVPETEVKAVGAEMMSPQP